ncbi:glycosyltransferase [Kosmotoga olearia]|uniref:Glycosyl transferase group 1 n=1 Tax=Kosmotoga olearia (strain ATCC BAA-1733 / DSM 21960 / TBF 19.5.1) TaxID=521045 RepID=C5CD80_KOSOT|nr:glycosyltransferase [Kosmotoga olearia]ACR79024.1 glycosyl transferase group 1 [Kosmotoga olearia TBF 19.5.1]
MKKVQTSKKSLSQFIDVVGEKKIDEIVSLASELKGLRVLHINATSFGGGVAEILHTLVPLMNNVGLKVDWMVLDGSNDFFDFTKKMHNSLQGKEGTISEEEKKLFLRINKANAQSLKEVDYNVIIIHDPQPIAVPKFVDFQDTKLIWRCHIDTSTPNEEFVEFLNSFVEYYDASIFTLKRYAGKLRFRKIYEIPPSIDPLSPKNRELTPNELKASIDKLKVDTNRPLITQVSRFDPWKDPTGVVDVYRELKKELKDLQLLMIGSMASDDPEGWTMYEELLRYIGRDYDVKVLTNFHGIESIEVNAAQRISDVVLQKSIREGFALTVSEALWKETPVVGGNVGGIPTQISHGVNGYLVNNIEEAVEYTKILLTDETLRKEMGKKGKDIVKEKFLITRHLLDYLKLFRDLVK